jgi:hypothetical protein
MSNDKQAWLAEAEKRMMKRFGIGLNDCGSPEEFWVRWGNECQDGTTPDEAVVAYGEKYDLIDFDG